jgi:hypothetical protein
MSNYIGLFLHICTYVDECDFNRRTLKIILIDAAPAPQHWLKAVLPTLSILFRLHFGKNSATRQKIRPLMKTRFWKQK